MGKQRRATLLAEKSLNASGTEAFEIVVKDPISQIWLVARPKNLDIDPDGHPSACIKTIELMHGSDVLYGCEGITNESMGILAHGIPSSSFVNYQQAMDSIMQFPIRFGRKPWDREYALVPANIGSLSLRIEYDQSLGGCAPSTMTLAVFADLFDEMPPTFKGYLRTWECKQYTVDQNAWEEINIPVDRNLRCIMAQSKLKDYSPHIQMHDFKMSEDQDKHVPFEGETSDFIKTVHPNNKPLSYMWWGHGDIAANEFFVTPTYYASHMLSPTDAAGIEVYGLTTYGGAIDIAQKTAAMFYALSHGYCPHSAILFPFGDLDKPEDWRPASPGSSLRLLLKAGSTASESGTTRVIIQQEVLY